MELSLKLNESETLNVINSLNKKVRNSVTIELDENDNLCTSHTIVDPHKFLSLFKVVLDGDFMNQLMQTLPEDILEEALKQAEIRDADIDDLDGVNLDGPAILPSEVLGNNNED